MELFYGVNDNRDTDPLCIEASINSQFSHLDRGFLSWIVTAFRITSVYRQSILHVFMYVYFHRIRMVYSYNCSDEELLQRAGPDGLLYILFERCLIILTIMMLVVSLCIALPINFHGNMQGDSATFSHTTLSNLDPSSSLIWVHTILILSYLPVGSFVMRRCLKQVSQ